MDTPTVLDLSSLATLAIKIGATATLALATRYLPRAMSAVDRLLDIQETAQQKATLNDAIQIGVGAIETKLDQKAMQVAHVNISNPNILAEAQAVLATAPTAAAAMGMTADGIAKAIVGGVDTLSRTAPVTTPSPTPGTVLSAAPAAA